METDITAQIIIALKKNGYNSSFKTATISQVAAMVYGVTNYIKNQDRLNFELTTILVELEKQGIVKNNCLTTKDICYVIKSGHWYAM